MTPNDPAASTPEARRRGGKTVQDYIDELPRWADGTISRDAPLTNMQWLIWGLASAGKFFEGLVVFMTGVALPLIVREFGLSAVEKGAVSAAALFGILVGAWSLGGLSDRYGRKTMFIVEMIIFTLSLVLVVFSPNFTLLVVFLFIMGTALGCDYPTAHMIISESIPSAQRGRLVLGAFGFQAVGALAGTAVGYFILHASAHLGAWRWMYATAIIPALLVLIGRFFIPQSGQWLAARGQIAEAERATQRLLRRVPPYPKEVRLDYAGQTAGQPRSTSGKSWRALFSAQHRRATILASLPWFLQDLGTYGIGIFTPTILAAVIGAKTKYAHNLSMVIHNDVLAAKGAAFIDLLLLAGIVCALLLADKIGRIRLQLLGFMGCALGLFMAAIALSFGGPARMLLIFGGFMLFSFMTNLGPNAMTYLISGEVFPTSLRGQGAGLAASLAKTGAVLTAFLFPLLIKDIGTQTLLFILVGTSLLGALITWAFRIETKGINLEQVGGDR